MKEPHEEVTDGGWGWVVLLGTFTGQLLISGTVANLGVYLVEWQEYFEVSAGAVSVIATEVVVLLHSTGVVSGALCRHYGCRPVMMFGGLMAMISALGAALSNQLWHLYICYAIAGVGHGICYIPTLTISRYYFRKRQGLANGITYAGIGAGLLVMAPAMERACSVYGWKGALLIHSAINANMIVCGALFRPSKLEKQMVEENRRNKPSSASNIDEDDDLKDNSKKSAGLCMTILRKVDDVFAISRLVRYRLYMVYVAATIFTMWGYVSTLIFLTPKVVYDLGFSKWTASLIMSTFGIASLVARAFHGFLLDHRIISVVNLYLLSVVVCGINPMFNPLVSTETGQYILAAIFGLGAGVMNAMNAQMCRHLVPMDIVSNGMGLMMTVSALGLVLGTQLMGELFDAAGSYDIPFYINGSVLWAAALVVWFFAKYSCWKDVPNPEESVISDSKIIIEDGIVASELHDFQKESVSTRYQPIPTGREDTQNDSSSNV